MDSFEEFCDNKFTIQIAKNPVQHDQTKHVEIDRHFIADTISKGTTSLTYIRLFDILTKALPKPTFDDFTFKLGLYNVYSPAWEGV